MMRIFFMLAVILFSAPITSLQAAPCDSFPPPPIEDKIVHVGTVAALKEAVSDAAEHTTILIEDGIYDLTSNLVIRTDHVTLRSKNGQRDSVVLDGGHWIGEPILVLGAQNVSVVDLTIQNAYFHLIHISGSADNFHVYNVLFRDSREQFLKVNADSVGVPDAGTVECSRFQLTPEGRRFLQNNPTPGFDCYTGGIDAHGTTGWLVRDNQFIDIYCTNNGLPEHCIHFWNDARDTVVERNYLQNCARGIGFGLTNSRGHHGGVIRNNMIWAQLSGQGIGHDSGIGLESAREVLVEHNTVYSAGDGFNAMIDMRFQTTGIIRYNLYYPEIRVRNGAEPELFKNEQASAAMFLDVGNGDLHLNDREAIDFSLIKDRAFESSIIDDFDGAPRDSVPDLGADELGNAPAVDTPVPESPTSCKKKSVKRKVKRRCRKRCTEKSRRCLKKCRKKRCRRLARLSFQF